MHHHKNSEKIFVRGEGALIFPISYNPEFIHAQFVHDLPPITPSCNPVVPDNIKIEVIELEVDFGIQLTWKVNSDFREIKWEAKEFVS